MRFELVADTTPIIEWFHGIKLSFPRMVETMKNVARIIELESVPLVPLDTGALEQSYEYQIVDSSNFILLGVGYDAVDEDSGFHYAEYQHNTEELNHPKRGQAYYLVDGIRNSQGEWMTLIEKDYLSLFNGGNVSKGSYGKNNEAHFFWYMNM